MAYPQRSPAWAAGTGLQRPESDPHGPGVKKGPYRCDCIVEALAPSRPSIRYRRAGSAGPRVNNQILRTPAAVSPVRNLCPSGRGSEPDSALQLGGCLLPVNGPAGWGPYHYVMDCHKLHTDDAPGSGACTGQKTKTGRIWTYVRDDRSAGSSDP